MKYIDLFSGIGGFHLAMESFNFECVLACEKDKHARKTYIENFSHQYPELSEDDQSFFPQDITQIDIKSIPDFNILCAGFPCQAFSQAGKKLGFQDTRGTLFFNVAQILQVKKPEIFILENVRNLLNHDSGRTFLIIKNTLIELGYDIHYKILNTADYGLPQPRKRLYIVGFKTPTSFHWPEPVELKYTMSDILNGECSRTLGYTLRCGGRMSPIHDKHNWDGFIVDNKEHRLTIQEACKMQGFPNSFLFPVSPNQAMKQIGNSVSVPVIQSIMNKILEVL